MLYGGWSIALIICTWFCCTSFCYTYITNYFRFTWYIYPCHRGSLHWHWGNSVIRAIPMKCSRYQTIEWVRMSHFLKVTTMSPRAKELRMCTTRVWQTVMKSHSGIMNGTIFLGVYCVCLIWGLVWQKHASRTGPSNYIPLKYVGRNYCPHYNDVIMGAMASQSPASRLFTQQCRSKKTSKLRVTGLCAGNSPGTGEFPAQMASNAENVSIWWRHYAVSTGCNYLSLLLILDSGT